MNVAVLGHAILTKGRGPLKFSMAKQFCKYSLRRADIYLQTNKTTMSSLPQEIITSILSRLPVKSLLKFRCVSKPWCSLIDDPNFVKLHLNQATENNNISLMVCDDNEDLYSVDYSTSCTEAVEIDYPGKGSFNGVEIVGSCNGLLCIHTDFFDVIWNPCTNEYKKLPIAPAVAESIEDWESHITYGFGYDSTVDDYKVVKVAFLHSGFDYEELDDDKNNEILGSVVEVYSLGTNSWHRIENSQYYMCSNSALCVNQRLNWLATKKASSDVPTLIVSFDFVAEQFHEVPHPKCVCSIMDARVLGGQLCILYRPSGGGADMWVMKDYGVIDSWNCLFTIPLLTEVEQPMMRILSFSKIGKLLLEYDHEDLVLYYPELEQYEVLQICGFPEWFKAEAYVGSLVSLKSGTYVEQKQAKKIAINAGDEEKRSSLLYTVNEKQESPETKKRRGVI